MVVPSHGDSFISDDEEELCPLCVEEMDISDKNFKPCPCGYQVCQFCYNNIRDNPELNGRCPACRRPYDDSLVEYRLVTQEELKQDQLRQTRKEKERKQRERERKETEQSSRKHLAGMRVIQKNLVYIIGLNPNIPSDDLHETLRGDQFFGQYGKIQKIVINKRTNANGNSGLGVYVTFARKEDAARCIAAVDGSVNDGKSLRAAYGTTKYCSSYLRGHPCPNPNCMFLHEPGEEADSYTRQDLSTIQHVARQEPQSQSQQPSLAGPSSLSNGNRTAPGTPVASRSASISAGAAPGTPAPAVTEDDAVNSNHGGALPPTASWAQRASPTVANKKLHSLSKGMRPSGSSSDLVALAVENNAAAAAAASSSSPTIAPTDPILKTLNESLDSLSKSGSFGFVFSSDLLDDDVGHAPSYFAFSSKKEDQELALASNVAFSGFFSSLIQKGAIDHQRELTSSQTGAHTVAARSSQSPQGQATATVMPGTVPVATVPAATRTLFSGNAKAQNSQELLAHLMKGTAKDSYLVQFWPYKGIKRFVNEDEYVDRFHGLVENYAIDFLAAVIEEGDHDDNNKGQADLKPTQAHDKAGGALLDKPPDGPDLENFFIKQVLTWNPERLFPTAVIPDNAPSDGTSMTAPPPPPPPPFPPPGLDLQHSVGSSGEDLMSLIRTPAVSTPLTVSEIEEQLKSTSRSALENTAEVTPKSSVLTLEELESSLKANTSSAKATLPDNTSSNSASSVKAILLDNQPDNTSSDSASTREGLVKENDRSNSASSSGVSGDALDLYTAPTKIDVTGRSPDISSEKKMTKRQRKKLEQEALLKESTAARQDSHIIGRALKRHNIDTNTPRSPTLSQVASGLKADEPTQGGVDFGVNETHQERHIEKTDDNSEVVTKPQIQKPVVSSSIPSETSSANNHSSEAVRSPVSVISADAKTPVAAHSTPTKSKVSTGARDKSAGSVFSLPNNSKKTSTSCLNALKALRPVREQDLALSPSSSSLSLNRYSRSFDTLNHSSLLRTKEFIDCAEMCLSSAFAGLRADPFFSEDSKDPENKSSDDSRYLEWMITRLKQDLEEHPETYNRTNANVTCKLLFLYISLFLTCRYDHFRRAYTLQIGNSENFGAVYIKALAFYLKGLMSHDEAFLFRAMKMFLDDEIKYVGLGPIPSDTPFLSSVTLALFKFNPYDPGPHRQFTKDLKSLANACSKLSYSEVLFRLSDLSADHGDLGDLTLSDWCALRRLDSESGQSGSERSKLAERLFLDAEVKQYERKKSSLFMGKIGRFFESLVSNVCRLYNDLQTPQHFSRADKRLEEVCTSIADLGNIFRDRSYSLVIKGQLAVSLLRLLSLYRVEFSHVGSSASSAKVKDTCALAFYFFREAMVKVELILDQCIANDLPTLKVLLRKSMEQICINDFSRHLEMIDKALILDLPSLNKNEVELWDIYSDVANSLCYYTVLFGSDARLKTCLTHVLKYYGHNFLKWPEEAHPSKQNIDTAGLMKIYYGGFMFLNAMASCIQAPWYTPSTVIESEGLLTLQSIVAARLQHLRSIMGESASDLGPGWLSKDEDTGSRESDAKPEVEQAAVGVEGEDTRDEDEKEEEEVSSEGKDTKDEDVTEELLSEGEPLSDDEDLSAFLSGHEEDELFSSEVATALSYDAFSLDGFVLESEDTRKLAQVIPLCVPDAANDGHRQFVSSIKQYWGADPKISYSEMLFKALFRNSVGTGLQGFQGFLQAVDQWL